MDHKIGDRRAEIYTYESENIVYGLSWSVSHLFTSVASEDQPRLCNESRPLLRNVHEKTSCYATSAKLDGCLKCATVSSSRVIEHSRCSAIECLSDKQTSDMLHV